MQTDEILRISPYREDSRTASFPGFWQRMKLSGKRVFMKSEGFIPESMTGMCGDLALRILRRWFFNETEKSAGHRIQLNKGDGYTMNLFCEEVHKLEAEFKQCRKLLNAIGDENRQHLICVMMNMPIDGGLVLEIVEQTHHPGCHSLIWKRSQGSHLRKTKNLQYGDRTQNHGQYKNLYTKIWTNQARTVLFWCLLQPVQDRIPEKCWEEGLQNPEWSWYVQFQRAA